MKRSRARKALAIKIAAHYFDSADLSDGAVTNFINAECLLNFTVSSDLGQVRIQRKSMFSSFLTKPKVFYRELFYLDFFQLYPYCCGPF